MFLQLDITLYIYQKNKKQKKAQSVTLPHRALPSIVAAPRAATPGELGLLCTPAPERSPGRSGLGWGQGQGRGTGEGFGSRPEPLTSVLHMAQDFSFQGSSGHAPSLLFPPPPKLGHPLASLRAWLDADATSIHSVVLRGSP